MVTKVIDCYEVTIKILLRKDDWKRSGFGKITSAEIEDRIQCGIEVPLEDCTVEIKE